MDGAHAGGTAAAQHATAANGPAGAIGPAGATLATGADGAARARGACATRRLSATHPGDAAGLSRAGSLSTSRTSIGLAPTAALPHAATAARRMDSSIATGQGQRDDGQQEGRCFSRSA
jgi:hypothetical protein